MDVHRFRRFWALKLELPILSAYSPYLKRLHVYGTDDKNIGVLHSEIE